MFCFLNDQQQRVLITYKNTKYVFISTRQWRSLHTKNKLIQNQFINLAPTTLQTGTHINIVANSFLDPELKINKDVRTDRGRWGRRGPSRRGCCWGCCWGARARCDSASNCSRSEDEGDDSTDTGDLLIICSCIDIQHRKSMFDKVHSR